MEKLNILYTTDCTYFKHMITSIYSLAFHNVSNLITIHIIEDGLTKDHLIELDKIPKRFPNIEMKFYSIGKIKPLMSLVNIPKFRETYIANARLFANQIVDVDKLLYIDSDTIIKGPLSSLFEKDCSTPVSAVRDAYIPFYLIKELDCYYNSGVLLFDFEKWDKDDYFKKMYDVVVERKGKFLLPDQDVLNLSFQGEIGTLDFGYNIFPNIVNLMKYPILSRFAMRDGKAFYTYDEVKKAINNPYIYHLLSFFKAKPWEKNNINPFNDVYDYYRNLWDCDYEKKESSSKFANKDIMPLLEAFCCATITRENYAQVKAKTSALVRSLKK